MPKQPFGYPRKFTDLTDAEIKNAVIEICKKLGIGASGSNYSLYEAILKERDHARHMADLADEAVNPKQNTTD